MMVRRRKKELIPVIQTQITMGSMMVTTISQMIQTTKTQMKTVFLIRKKLKMVLTLMILTLMVMG